MSEPEIARRCHACGASIRDHAAFCPQCGKEQKTTAELNDSGKDQNVPSDGVDTAPLQKSSIPQEQATPPIPASGSGRQSQHSGKQPAPAKPTLGQVKRTPEQAGGTRTTAATPAAHLVAEARGKVQRATGIARHVGGDVVQRGHKLREMSSVVLDEASYDPSLRFVLVAAALFVLFLVIVLLNRFIV